MSLARRILPDLAPWRSSPAFRLLIISGLTSNFGKIDVACRLRDDRDEILAGREFEPERASVSFTAVYTDTATRLFYNRFADCQAETSAFFLGGICGFHLFEPLKYLV